MQIIEKIVDITTQTEQIVEREMSALEIAAYEKDLADLQAQEAKAAEAAEARVAVEAKLATLGITADDLRALGL